MSVKTECPSCGNWKCNDCGWIRPRASRYINTLHACGRCGGSNGTMYVTKHNEKTYVFHGYRSYEDTYWPRFYPLEGWDYCHDRYFSDDAIVLNSIADAMSGKEWSADTLDIIAGLIRGSGRDIRDLNDDDDYDDY